jgi:predicted RNase H-like nuclease
MNEEKQATLLVGFDSAWTPQNKGGLVGILQTTSGNVLELNPPCVVDFPEAQSLISKWQVELGPKSTIILLDQPTIVPNVSGQRPVENIVGSVVGLRYGGMQPANTSKTAMFGPNAPIWSFLKRFGGSANPVGPLPDTMVIETYPVLTIIALGWTLPDLSKQDRPAGRLPKYNPERKTFSPEDWRHVCERASAAFREFRLTGIVEWINNAGRLSEPHKEDQDRLDACLCLLVALQLAEGRDCLMVGNLETGYIVVPHGTSVHAELDARCEETGRVPAAWTRILQLKNLLGIW